MDSEDIIEGEWRELPPPDDPSPDVPPAVRARARLAQAVALRDMESSWQARGRVVSAPAPRLRPVPPHGELDSLWLASHSASRSERARAAERLAMHDFLSRPRRPHPPLRSI
ncbi:MAG TPA: hypothetical protein VK457_00990 [Chloroflexota bacterium]|nr:hypothetical protein [Chloroflexota bacterium]